MPLTVDCSKLLTCTCCAEHPCKDITIMPLPHTSHFNTLLPHTLHCHPFPIYPVPIHSIPIHSFPIYPILMHPFPTPSPYTCFLCTTSPPHPHTPVPHTAIPCTPIP